MDRKCTLIVFVFVCTLVACSQSDQEIKQQMEQQLKERVNKYYTLEKYKDSKGMSNFVYLRKNVQMGGHIFKDSREYFISVYESGLMAPLESFEILDMQIDLPKKRAIVKVGTRNKRGILEATSSGEVVWLYSNGYWYIDILHEEYARN
jgi:hypothetical protein